MIRGYIGGGKQFDEQLAAFASAYAQQVQTDYESFVAYRLPTKQP